MALRDDLHEDRAAMAPQGCPQCPEGGYDLVAGSRRGLLLGEMNRAVAAFQEDGEIHELLESLRGLIVRGLEIVDLDRTVLGGQDDDLFIGCREIVGDDDEPRIEISLIDGDRRYLVEVPRAEVDPLKTFEIAGCPLVGREDRPGCEPETCAALLKARRQARG